MNCSGATAGLAALLLSMAVIAMPKPEFKPETTAANGGEQSGETAVAIFAGGCFWCMEPPFDKADGVIDTVSGYIGGHVAEPTYKQVTTGATGHYEAVKVVYDPQRITYPQLLDIFWVNVDPLDDRGQFCDKGQQYLSAIFAGNLAQQDAAEQSLEQLRESGRLQGEIATRILPASTFYPAEPYHQNYYQNNPLRYHFYRSRCGRDDRLRELWGKERQQ